jgi:hypothetical protein
LEPDLGFGDIEVGQQGGGFQVGKDLCFLNPARLHLGNDAGLT